MHTTRKSHPGGVQPRLSALQQKRLTPNMYFTEIPKKENNFRLAIAVNIAVAEYVLTYTLVV